jgi:hypothetical protein
MTEPDGWACQDCSEHVTYVHRGWRVSRRPWMAGRWYISHPEVGELPGYRTEGEALEAVTFYEARRAAR